MTDLMEWPSGVQCEQCGRTTIWEGWPDDEGAVTGDE